MGKKLKHTSSRLKGLSRSGSAGLWEARKAIPEALRPVFGKREFKAALNTKDENEAIRLGAPLLADWSDQIDAAKGRVALAAKPLPRQAIDRDRAYLAIQRWKSQQIKDALNLAFNGALEPAPVGFSDEMRAHVHLVGSLREGDWSAVADFDHKLAAALKEQRVMCDPKHPAIPSMRDWFADALATVEHRIMEYRKGKLSDAPEPPAPIMDVAFEPPGELTTPPSSSSTKIMEVYDLWEASGAAKLEPRHRGYVKRLVEYLGDPDIADVTALQMDAMKLELEKFPLTKRLSDDEIPFTELIALAQQQGGYRTLHIKTVWNWITTYKRLFEFALDRDLIRKNPAAKTMRKPSAEESEERDPYDDDDLAAIFSAPMFNGFAGSGSRGYRDRSGSNVVRDHKYWLPILGLWTGGRVEELATLETSEIKIEGGVHYIDLTERPLKGPRRVKNRSARRIIPIHDRLVQLGFLKHVAALPPGPLFPKLNRNGKKASASFGPWWGRWCHANAKVEGEGLDDPAKVFHSFRHTWKQAVRETDVKDEIHDLISGHSGGNAVGRAYGRGARISVLKAAMDRIDFPTFPL